VRVLFIDDEPVRAKMIPNEHDVYIAHGGEQVGYYLHEKRYDLVCCDHDMPMMDGLAVCSNFLVQLNLPVIVHSQNIVCGPRMVQLLQDYSVWSKWVPYSGEGWWQKVLDIVGSRI